MQSNTSIEHEQELRKAVEQQLDLILKMEEQRKVLKRENRMLNNQLKSAKITISKYAVETAESATNTEDEPKQVEINRQQEEDRKSEVEHKDQGIQVQNQNNAMILNCSKLTEAQSLLKALDQTDLKIEESTSRVREVPKKVEGGQNNKQISNQIVKMSKQINCLKKQVKESQQKHNQKEKQIRQLKKCLQTKSQALQKSRKDFNQLSTLMNTDKYKSVRLLEQEINNLKTKLIKQEDGVKIKKILEGVTEQYEQYKVQMEKKFDILVAQLASKEQQIDEIKDQNKTLRRQVQPN